MKCPDCGEIIDVDIEQERYVCPNCKKDVTEILRDKQEFIANSADEIAKFVGGIVIGGIIAIFALLALFNIGGFFLGFFYINKVFNIIRTILKVLLFGGIGIFIICLILFILNKRTKLLRNIWIVSVVLITVPLVVINSVKIDGDISTTDYSKQEYIELGEEKIPSLYSVVGERKIVMSDEQTDYYSPEFKEEFDMIMLLYSEMSIEDMNKYIDEIIEFGFEKETVYDEGELHEFYVKNNYDANQYYVIGINDFSITYSVGEGKYEGIK